MKAEKMKKQILDFIDGANPSLEKNWHSDEQEAKLMYKKLIFHLIYCFLKSENNTTFDINFSFKDFQTQTKDFLEQIKTKVNGNKPVVLNNSVFLTLPYSLNQPKKNQKKINGYGSRTNESYCLLRMHDCLTLFTNFQKLEKYLCIPTYMAIDNLNVNDFKNILKDYFKKPAMELTQKQRYYYGLLLKIFWHFNCYYKNSDTHPEPDIKQISSEIDLFLKNLSPNSTQLFKNFLKDHPEKNASLFGIYSLSKFISIFSSLFLWSKKTKVYV